MLSELLQSRVHYILNNMEDAVCLTEMNGELVYANPAAERSGVNDSTNKGVEREVSAQPQPD